MLKVYTDAATKGNPGPSSGGLLISGNGLHLQKSFPLPESSNHEAEFGAVLWGLRYLVAEKLHQQTLMLFTDSQIVAQTIDAGFSRNPQFQPYVAEILPLLDQFPLAIVQWIPEKQNQGAHQLALQGLKQLQKAQYKALKKNQQTRPFHPDTN